MPRKVEGLESIGIHLEQALADGLRELAARNGRSFRDEITSAVRRHLATPPVVASVEGPPLEPESVPAGLTPQRGRRKRVEE